MKFFKSIPFVLILIFLLVVFGNWFAISKMSAADFPFLFDQRISDYQPYPYVWSSLMANGLGGGTWNTLYLTTYISVLIYFFHQVFNLPWILIMRLIIFWPFVLGCTASSYFLVKLFVKDKVYSFLGALIYTTNTFILMLAGGGQVGLILSYAVIPFLLLGIFAERKILAFISTFFMILFDLRFGLLTFGVILFYSLLNFGRERLKIIKLFIPLILALGVHSFWLIPGIAAGSLGPPAEVFSARWVDFLSWSNFSGSLALLHPNWPENIFGKTSFMKPEFLLLPMIGFLSLFLLKNDKKNKSLKFYEKPSLFIPFFIILSILGAFFGKGVKEPFSDLYRSLYEYFPLFNGFRDPIKFFLITSISYSILIPYSLRCLGEMFSKNKFLAKRKVNFYTLPFFGFIVLWFILTFPILFLKTPGTFQKVDVPDEYYKLASYLASDEKFYRVMTAPSYYRFVYSSENKPNISASHFFQETDFKKLSKFLVSSKGIERLKETSVKYLIIPDDFTSELFLTDRKYDENLRENFISVLDSNPGFKRLTEFNKITVFEITGYKPGLIFKDGKELKFLRKNPAEYYSFVENGSKSSTDLVFKESFDKAWKAWDGKKVYHSYATMDGFNGFKLDNNGSYLVTIYNTNQDFLNYGLVVSLFIFSVFLIYLPYRKHKYFLLIIFFACVVFYFNRDFQAKTMNNIFSSKPLSWKLMADKLTNRKYWENKYGGGEVDFSISDAGYLEFLISGLSRVKGIGVEISVDGKKQVFDNPEENPIIEIRLNFSKDKHNFKLKTFCSGNPYCSVKIHKMKYPFGAGIEINKKEKMTLMVLGDSLSSQYGSSNYSFKLADMLNADLVNASVWGGTLSDYNGYFAAVNRIDEIIMVKPDIIFLALGTNDAGGEVLPEQFIKKYSELIEKIQVKLPRTKIYILALFARFDSRKNVVSAFNRELLFLSAEKNIEFIDLFDRMFSEDYIDSLHFTLSAQDKIANLLFNSIKK